MTIVLIAAAAENGVIEQSNTIPWRLKTDQQRLKAITMGKLIVMGRKISSRSAGRWVGHFLATPTSSSPATRIFMPPARSTAPISPM